MLETLALADFQSHVDSEFTFSAGDLKAAATLRNARGMGQQEATAEHRAPFSLLFCVESKQPLPQAIYRLEHVALGTIEVFCVPVEQTDQGCMLETVFA